MYENNDGKGYSMYVGGSSAFSSTKTSSPTPTSSVTAFMPFILFFPQLHISMSFVKVSILFFIFKDSKINVLLLDQELLITGELLIHFICQCLGSFCLCEANVARGLSFLEINKCNGVIGDIELFIQYFLDILTHGVRGEPIHEEHCSFRKIVSFLFLKLSLFFDHFSLGFFL